MKAAIWLTHAVTGSVTKSAGRWTIKAGSEYRVSYSNYEDFAQGSKVLPSISGCMSRITW